MRSRVTCHPEPRRRRRTPSGYATLAPRRGSFGVSAPQDDKRDDGGLGLSLEAPSSMVTFEKAPPEARQLLPVRIRDLGLSLERSPVAKLVHHLYAELEAKGLQHFRPACY